MDFGWSEAEQQLHQRMRDLGMRVADLPAADDGTARLAALAEAGVFGLCLDPAYGGGGHSLTATAYALEGLGATLNDGGVLLALGAHLFGVGLTLQKVGTAAQRQHWLPRLADGSCLATVAATEAGTGSDIGQAEATVEQLAEGGYRLAGHKAYVTRAASACVFLFVGRAIGGGCERGLSVALLPADTAGITVEAPLDLVGLQHAALAPVQVVDAQVDGAALLGRHGAGMAVFQTAMTYERALVLAFRLGAMEASLRAAIRWVRQRRLGDTAIAGHQAVTHRLARMQQRLESARLLTYRAAWLLDQGKRAQAEAALAKWQLADSAVDNALDDLRLRGGAGYLRQSGLAAALDDALGGSIHSGTSDVLANIVAGWMGL